MPNPDTITRGAGQARRSAARLILSVAKYTGLTLAGIILFRAGAAYALTERGYSAVGPRFMHCFRVWAGDTSKTRKTAICRTIRRTTNNEETC